MDWLGRQAVASAPSVAAETVAVIAEIRRESAALMLRVPSIDSSGPLASRTPQSSSYPTRRRAEP